MTLSPWRVLKGPSERALYLYVAAIVAPTCALLVLSVRSVEHERRALRAATTSNLQLSGEQVVTQIEDHLRHVAEEQSFDLTLDFSPLLTAPATLQSTRRLRTWFDQRRNKDLVDEFFLIEGDAVTYPPLHAPPRVPSGAGDRFADAERYEFREGRVDLALDAYRRLEESATSGAMRAMALWRLARCLRKLHHESAAVEVYREIASRYQEEYDPFQRPYGLLTVFEFDDPQRLSAFYGRFAQGYWEMPADNVEYFLQRFRERLGGTDLQDTRFLRHFRTARLVEARFRYSSHLQRGRTYFCALAEKPFVQFFYTPIDTTLGKERLLAFSVRLETIPTNVLQDARHLAGVGEEMKLVEAGMPLEADRPRAVFKYLFPFWQVEVSPSGGQNLGNRDTLVFGGITALILVTLVTGVLLLMRDNWRQWQLNQLRSSLVTGISHDLKTPVTGIRVYADILADGTELTEEDRKKYSRIIQRESERLTNTIERVLDFSRIEKGRRPYCFEEGDLTPVLVRVVEMYRTYWSPRGFSIVTDFASSVPLVRFDEEAVSQAVLNLLDNAVKYSGEGRDIKVELGVNDSFVIVSVADRGIGIAHSEQSRIFEEFYRAQPQHGKGGVGLGLYLVRQIMDAHGGRVEVESELRYGSRFQLIFPVWPKS